LGGAYEEAPRRASLSAPKPDPINARLAIRESAGSRGAPPVVGSGLALALAVALAVALALALAVELALIMALELAVELADIL
jgi:hypothetical protein